MELQDAREEIRQIDEEMARLFERRMEAVRKVAAYKNKRGLPILDKEQEARVLEGRSSLIRNPELQPFYREFLQETMDIIWSGGSFYAAARYCSYFSNGVKTPSFLCSRLVL